MKHGQTIMDKLCSLGFLNDPMFSSNVFDCPSLFDGTLGDPVQRILWGAETANRVILEEVLKVDPALVNACDQDGYTPLHRAAYEGHTHIIQVTTGSFVYGCMAGMIRLLIITTLFHGLLTYMALITVHTCI